MSESGHAWSRNSPTKQATLADTLGGCPVCLSDPTNVAEHLLTEHQDVVNQRITDILEPAKDNRTDDQGNTVLEELTEDTASPALFWETPDDTPGHNFGSFVDPRACNDCGTRMSQGYRRTFGWPNGDLWCPDCKSRSERYSNDRTYGDKTGTDPSKVRGTANGMHTENDKGVLTTDTKS